MAMFHTIYWHNYRNKQAREYQTCKGKQMQSTITKYHDKFKNEWKKTFISIELEHSLVNVIKSSKNDRK